MSQELERRNLVSYRDEEYEMERENVPSSVSSSFVNEMTSLDLLSQESDALPISDNEEKVQEVNAKPVDGVPIVGGPPSTASKFSILSLKPQNIHKNKKAVYEIVIPNSSVKSGGKTKKQHKSHENMKKFASKSQLKSSQSKNLTKSKRKKIIDVGTEQSIRLPKSNKGIFSNLRILFISNNIDKLRLNLMKSKVLDKGGIIEENFEFDGNLTHIITELSGKQLIAMFGVRKLKRFENVKIVRPNWISESIMYGKLMYVESYAVSLTEESIDSSNIAGSQSSQNLKRSNNEQKDGEQEGSNSYEVLDKKRQRLQKFSPSPTDVMKDDDSLLESDINNDMNYTSSVNNDIIVNNDPLLEMIVEAKKLTESGLYLDEGGENENESMQDEITTSDSNDELKVEIFSGEITTDVTNSDELENPVDINAEPSSVKPENFRGQNSFACMHSSKYEETNNNPNKMIIEKLQILLDHYTRMKDEWRMISYRKAISAIKKRTKPITSYEEARKISGIGTRTAEKIAEIIDTGNLRRINHFSEGENIIKKFSFVYGVGSSVAMKWYAKGYRTFEDDLQKRIPREEVQKISDWVKSAALSIDYKLECITTGSFRRGRPDCGDIDIMITRNDSDGKNHLGVLTKLVEILSNQGFLTHELTRHDGDSLSAKFMGICKLPEGIHRRLDLFTVPYNEIGAALLSYTGNDIFNRSMRLMARKRKMCLNQHGLYMNVSRGYGGVKYNEGRLLAQKTEQEIFDALGVPWR
ncbi:2599_t:CDS:10 [Funneliformis mosseae]|uniref:DNA polymerase lambda n=1 Tax=Funneliformis mosseae TaxID=27381 RepID=A0A9N9FU27_FUNMO|nr:2599_t:CDS:10 [Funneliformis mosseae]